MRLKLVQFSSVAQSCPTLCNPMTGSPVLPHLPEFAQTHVLWVDDAIQLSNPLLPPSLAFNLFQHHGLFQWVGSLHQVAELLELQRQSFQWILRWLPLGLTGLISLQSKELSTVFSSTMDRKHQFFGAQPSLGSNSDICRWLWKNCSFDYTDLCQQSDISAF